MRKEEAYRNIHYCTVSYIGGLENMESDYRGTEDGDAATAELNDHNALVENIMYLSVTGIYGAGYENCSKQAELRAGEYKLLGNDVLRGLTEIEVKNMGY
jgi:hypothetical protein